MTADRLSPVDLEKIRALPHSIEAEQALIGAVMFDNAVLERLPEHLKGEHFHEPVLGRAFDHALRLVGTGEVADPRTLGSLMAEDPALVHLGGTHHLADLVDAAPPGFSAPSYARTIYDLAIRRDLIRLGQELAEAATDTQLPAAEHLAQAEAALFGLAEAGETSKGICDFGSALDGALDMAVAAYSRDGQLTGLSTGLVDLDQKLGGLHRSDLLVIAGRPSMGKTALATNIAYNAARAWRGESREGEPGKLKTVAGARVLFASLEMSKEQLAGRILADATGISGDRARKGLISASELGRMKDAAAELRAIPLHIDPTGGIAIGRFCARARRHHRKHGIDLIVVDYLQLMTTGGNGKNRVQEVSEITSALKALAKELNVPIVALSQLSRQVETRDDKRPMLSDLRESGSIEQDADAVMFVFREAYYLERAEPKEGSAEHLQWVEDMERLRHQAELIVAKQRHGPIGTVRLSFDSDTTRFGNLAREPDQGPRERYSFGGDA